MNASLEILGSSSMQTSASDTSPARQLDCTLLVAQSLLDLQTFDTAKLLLRGHIRSNINGTKSRTPFVALSKSLHWSDFYPTTPCTTTSKSRKQADVTFNLGKADANSRTHLLPFASLDVTSEVTSDHALSNRRQIRARSQTHYTFEVIFYNKAEKVHVSTGTVAMQPTDHVLLTASRPRQTLDFPLKTIGRSKLRQSLSRSTPKDSTSIRISLERSMGATVYDRPPTVGTSTLSIPFTLDLSTDGESTSPQVNSLIHRGASCNVTTKWYIHRSISRPGQALSTNNINAVVKSSVITVKDTIALPPFYHFPQTTTYTSRGSLPLELPRTALIPTVDIEGLSIRYELEMHFTVSPATTSSNDAEVPLGKRGHQPPPTPAAVAETTFRFPVNLTAG